ncbi:SMI1/KNR4 family protein [Bacillus sp. 2205SS5-2]|uniref:SMI1/KNR4 family protein n=1 Tax=Bacillus sp. 2205SS5-2 TaxID=3109031 RepID=UPI003004C81C
MKNNIWQEDNDYFRLEPLTDAMIKNAEESLNLQLPKSFINILKEQNGGYIKFDAHPSSVPTSWAEDHVNVDHILGIGEKGGILESGYLIKEWGLPNDLVLISGDGHTWIAMDYRRRREEPPIIFIDIDDEQIVELAPNFETFFDGLTNWEEEIMVEPKQGFFSRFFRK